MSYRRCEKCRTWRGCLGYAWYQPFEIERNFCKNQVIFLIHILDILEDGNYSPDPQYTGYVGGNIGGFRPGARFLRAADLFSEITVRLVRTGEDGETLKHEVRQFDAGIYQLSQAARNALNYCCGAKRKRMKYREWLTQREKRIYIKTAK